MTIFITNMNANKAMYKITHTLGGRGPGICMITIRPTTSPILTNKTTTPRQVRNVNTGFVPGVCSTSMISRMVKMPSSRTVHDKHRLTTARKLLTKVSSKTTICTTQGLTRHPRFTKGVVITLLPSANRHCLSARLFTFSTCPLRWVIVDR